MFHILTDEHEDGHNPLKPWIYGVSVEILTILPQPTESVGLFSRYYGIARCDVLFKRLVIHNNGKAFISKQDCNEDIRNARTLAPLGDSAFSLDTETHIDDISRVEITDAANYFGWSQARTSVCRTGKYAHNFIGSDTITVNQGQFRVVYLFLADSRRVILQITLSVDEALQTQHRVNAAINKARDIVQEYRPILAPVILPDPSPSSGAGWMGAAGSKGGICWRADTKAGGGWFLFLDYDEWSLSDLDTDAELWGPVPSSSVQSAVTDGDKVALALHDGEFLTVATVKDAAGLAASIRSALSAPSSSARPSPSAAPSGFEL